MNPLTWEFILILAICFGPAIILMTIGLHYENKENENKTQNKRRG